MKEAIWNRVGPIMGILFFGLVFTGLFVHGYPDVRPTDAQLAQWLASVDVNKFSVGIYMEELGIALFIPFAAWLYGHLKQGRPGASWPAIVMFASATAWVILALPINEFYLAIVQQAPKGLDIRVAQTVVSINQAWFDMDFDPLRSDPGCSRVDTLFDTLAVRLPDTPGDSLRRLRHKSEFD